MFHDPNSLGEGPASQDLDVAIVGMAGRFPGAVDIDAYWRNLREGVESVVAFTEAELLAAGVPASVIADPDYVRVGAPLQDMEMFDPALFGLTPREAAIMDPQHRHFLECAWEALENAGHSVERFAGPIGVFGGSGHNAYLARNLLTNPDLVRSTGFFLLRHTGNDKDFLTTRASYLLDLKGPSIAVQTACSTSLVAIHTAVQSLLARECDMALAGGVTVELPHRQGYRYEEGSILSPDGHCRPFDADARGTVFGSGVGIVVLRRLREAIDSGDHIYAVIKGTAVNNDGSGKVGYLAPSVDGQAHVILEALTIAGVPADTIGYVEAHGTGTSVGDPIEVAALSQAFRRGTDKVGFCALGSVKGNIGHTDTAAGVAGVIKVALALHKEELPPSLNYRAPNGACGFDHGPFYVNDTLRPWMPSAATPRRAGISSLGVGGTNAHVILEQAPARRYREPSEGPYLLALSAATETALDAATRKLGEFLAADPSIDLGDVEYTLQVGRQVMAHRRSLVVGSREDAVAVLGGEAPDRLFSHRAEKGQRSVAFLFAGGGAQHPNMGLDLYREEAEFRSAINECLQVLRQECGVDLRDSLYPTPGNEESAAAALERPSIGLPALFATQYAQAKLWAAWGVVPSGMIGHSMGEYVAAHLAGVFSLADALRIVHLRGKLFETLPAGAMLAVPMPAEDLAPLIAADLSIAAHNAPRSTVVSGPCEAIEALRLQLEEIELPSSLLRISVAAHSAMLDPILEEFATFLGTIELHAPKLPFVSALTGTWMTAAQAQDPGYWVRHLREPVQFEAGLRQLLKDDTRDLLEVGPGRVLTGLALQHPDRLANQSVLHSSRHPDEVVSDKAFMLGVAGKLWAVGGPVLFGFLHGGRQDRRRIPLPTYCFDHQRYWIEPGRGANEFVDTGGDPLARRGDSADWLYRPAWHRTVKPRATQDVGQMLIFADDCGIGMRLAHTWRQRGGTVVMVHAGRRFDDSGKDRFTIDPADAGHYVRLVARLAAQGKIPDRIYHLWSVTGARGASGILTAADRMQTLGFYSLLHLAQAIGAEDISSPMTLMVVSDGMQRVCEETGLVPAKATLLGPCRVIPREFVGIRTISIDIVLPVPGSRQEQTIIDMLVAEPDAEDRAETVALRVGDRWVQRYEQVERQTAPLAGRPLRANGTYVVTGGLGDLGLAVARHLAETAGANVVLIARNPLPPRQDWLFILGGTEADSRTAQRIRQVLAIENLGSDVLIIGADVADPVEMRRAIRRAKSRFGAIHGVFHTAGVLDDAVMQMKTVASAGATLSPKVRGTLALQAALAGERPDFVMLFSSVSAALGVEGQVDYAAANAFLDAFAQADAASGSGNVIAVDWGPWSEIGMAEKLARGVCGNTTQADAAEGSTRHPFIDGCILNRPDERVYVTRFEPGRHWLLDEHRTRGGGALIPGTGFIEIVRGAAAERPEPGSVEFHDVLFLEPFCVDDGEARELSVRLSRERDDGWSFEVTSENSEADMPGTRTTHVCGTLRHVDAVQPEPLALEAIRARCGEPHRATPAPMMCFGPRWDNVVAVRYGTNEALIELALPSAGASDPATLEIHPALLDMATAGAQALMPGFDPESDFFVPASYGAIRQHGALKGPLFSHVRLDPETSSGDAVTFGVTVCDAHGTVLIAVTDFMMVRLRDPSLLARTGAPKEAMPVATSSMPTSNGIRPAEGMAVIERILESEIGAQVVVSPQDFNMLLAQARAPLIRSSGPCSEPSGGLDPTMSGGQQMIAALWQEILGVDRIGPTDNFFDLGGHSLLAVQFVNRLRKRTGTAVAATTLIQAPTVAALAALIAPEEDGLAADETDSRPAATRNVGTEALLIMPGGDGIPLFLIHDGLGEILLYRGLALKLDQARPVYGLQPEARGDGSIVHTEIRTMAAAHIAKLRRVRPAGPYMLAGLCAGGVIAVEMARQLEEAGEEVAYLGIIDAADVEARERPFFVSRLRFKRFVRVLDGTGASAEAVGGMARKFGNLVAYEGRRAIRTLGVRRDVQRLRAVAAHDVEPDGSAAAFTVPKTPYLDIYKVAHREHRPQGVVRAGHVALYRATSGSGAPDDMPFSEQFTDCALGWGERVAEPVEIVPVPGGHVTALQEPHVATLARAMQAGIAVALGCYGGEGMSMDQADSPPPPCATVPTESLLATS